MNRKLLIDGCFAKSINSSGTYYVIWPVYYAQCICPSNQLALRVVLQLQNILVFRKHVGCLHLLC